MGIGNNRLGQSERITINLEDALLEESRLYEVIELLRDMQNVSMILDDWWDLTSNNHFITVLAQFVIKDT